MSKPLKWFYKGSLSTKAKLALAGGIIALLIAGVSGGSWYFYHLQEEKAKEEKRLALEAIERRRTNIHNFYQEAFKGGNIKAFLALYHEILKSRLPLMAAGYTETFFSCDTGNCRFSYQPDGQTIFNVQDKIFWNEKFPASFSQTTMDYQSLPSKLENNALLEAFKQREKITVLPVCNVMLNYIYGYNSLASKDRIINLIGLPASSVESDETAMPGNPENYGLLSAGWTINLPDDYEDVSAFWHTQPFPSAFVIKSVEKNKDVLTVKGAFLCKK